MKKLLTVVCLSGLLSVPSVVFAEASWYGSLRAGISSSGTVGVSDGWGAPFNSSRWGIKGTSEVSEGLTAVYNFEYKIDASDASQNVGRLSYVGLSGGFGTLTVGQIWSASYNSVGAITDNSTFLGDSETSYRNGHSVSYAVSVESISIQADAIMNNGWGARSIAKDTNTADGVDTNGVAEDKNVDAMEIGVSMGLGEYGKIAFAHKSHDTAEDVKTKSNWIAGQYTIGGMTAYLGFGQEKTEDDTGAAELGNDETHIANQTDKTTFAGLRGSVGDTGVSYVFQARSKKTKGTMESGAANIDGNVEADLDADKHTPWFLGLSRSLGGGASVHFEHSNPDKKGSKSTSYLALKVDF